MIIRSMDNEPENHCISIIMNSCYTYIAVTTYITVMGTAVMGKTTDDLFIRHCSSTTAFYPLYLQLAIGQTTITAPIYFA